jgi:hypothetical protein
MVYIVGKPLQTEACTFFNSVTHALYRCAPFFSLVQTNAATGYGLADRELGVRVPVVSRMFCSLRRPDRFWGPPSLYPMGTGVARPGSEADHSLPTSAEVKKCGSIHLLPIRLHGVVFN